MIIRVARRTGSAEMRPASSSPSIPGIRWSRMAIWYGCPADAAARSRRSARRGIGHRVGAHVPRGQLAHQDQPVGGVVVHHQRPGRRRVRSRSTAVSCDGRRAPKPMAGQTRTGCLPRPHSPPRSGPPCRRPVAARWPGPGRSRRTAGWWRRQPGRRTRTGGAGRPPRYRSRCRLPRTAPARVSPSASSSRTMIATSPDSVNFTALPARLSSIWRMRPGSPRRMSEISGAQ